MNKRLFDLTWALFLFIILSPMIILVTAIIKIFDPGPAIYWSKRVGKNNQLFLMPKFRTMRVDTPQVATHLLNNPDQYLIPFWGKLLRKTSLDELPQLISIIRGDMSFVGPRPALYNQDDLIQLRTSKGIHQLTPGLTGWAQINGRDELPIPVKVDFDFEYYQRQSFLFDVKIIGLTLKKVMLSEGIKH